MFAAEVRRRAADDGSFLLPAAHSVKRPEMGHGRSRAPDRQRPGFPGLETWLFPQRTIGRRAMGFDIAAIHAPHLKAEDQGRSQEGFPRLVHSVQKGTTDGFGVTSRGGRRSRKSSLSGAVHCVDEGASTYKAALAGARPGETGAP